MHIFSVVRRCGIDVVFGIKMVHVTMISPLPIATDVCAHVWYKNPAFHIHVSVQLYFI